MPVTLCVAHGSILLNDWLVPHVCDVLKVKGEFNKRTGKTDVTVVILGTSGHAKPLSEEPVDEIVQPFEVVSVQGVPAVHFIKGVPGQAAASDLKISVLRSR